MAKKKPGKMERDLVQAIEFFELIKKERTQAPENIIISERLTELIAVLKEEVYQVARQRLGIVGGESK